MTVARPTADRPQPTSTAALWTRVERWLTGWIAGAALLLATYQLVARYAYPQAATLWIDEVVVYLVIWATSIACSSLAAGNSHVRADLVLRMLPAGMRRVAEAFNTGATLLVCLLLAWYGWLCAWDAYVIDERSQSGISFPMWMYYASLPVGAGLMSLRYAIRLWVLAFSPRSEAPEEEPHG